MAAPTAAGPRSPSAISEMRRWLSNGSVLPPPPGGVPAFQFMTTHLETILAIAAGDFTGAEVLAERGLTQDLADDSARGAGVYGVQMYAIRRAQGRLAEVTPVLELLARSADPPPVWRPGLAALYAELGMLDEARAQFDQLSPDSFAAVARDSMWPACLMFLAETCLALGDTDRADVLAAELLPFHGRNLMAAFTICFGPADRLLGGLAELSRRPPSPIATSGPRWNWPSAATHHFGRRRSSSIGQPLRRARRSPAGHRSRPARR